MLWFLIIYIIIISFALGAWSLAPWVPTHQKDVERSCALLRLQPGETFYDLGCGDGRMVLYAARYYNVKAIGIELALPLYLVCIFRKYFTKIAKTRYVTFKWKHLAREHLGSADAIYVFGRPSTNEKKLRVKLERELKSGARILSYAFPINGWTPKSISKPTKRDVTLYLYER